MAFVAKAIKGVFGGGKKAAPTPAPAPEGPKVETLTPEAAAKANPRRLFKPIAAASSILSDKLGA